MLPQLRSLSWVLVVAGLALGLSGCEGTADDPSGRPRPSATASSPTVPAVPTSEAVIPVRWTANGTTWRVAFAAGFGPRTTQLGLKTYPDQAPILPPSIAVDDSGVWVLDPQKGRLCLYSPAGTLLRTYPGVSQQASDLAFGRDGKVVVLDREPTGELLVLRDGKLRSLPRVGHTYRLVQIPGSAVPVRLGRNRALFSNTYARTFDPWLDLGDQRLSFSYTQSGPTTTVTSSQGWATDITFRPQSRPQHVVAPLVNDLTIVDGVAYISARPGSFSSHPFSRPLYLVQLDLTDGSLLDYERLRQGTIDRTNQTTDVAVSERLLWQLVIDSDGLTVRSRPR